MFYSTAIDKEKRHEIQSSREVDYIVIPAGQFLSISHQGSAKECIKFATYLFHDLLPKLRNEVESGIEIEVIEIDSCHAESKLRDIAVVYRYLMAVN